MKAGSKGNGKELKKMKQKKKFKQREKTNNPEIEREKRHEN